MLNNSEAQAIEGNDSAATKSLTVSCVLVIYDKIFENVCQQRAFINKIIFPPVCVCVSVR